MSPSLVFFVQESFFDTILARESEYVSFNRSQIINRFATLFELDLLTVASEYFMNLWLYIQFNPPFILQNQSHCDSHTKFVTLIIMSDLEQTVGYFNNPDDLTTLRVHL